MQSSFVSNVPNNLTGTDLRNTIQSLINAGVLPEPGSNTCLIVYLADELAVNDPGEQAVLCEPNNDTAFGFHTFFKTTAGHNFPFAVIPGLTNACVTNSCGNDASCLLHLTEDQTQRQTQVTSHEFAEMITDPELNAWWDANSGYEIGDICNGESATITVGTHNWTVQLEYSRTDDLQSNGATFCLIEAANPIPKLIPGPASSLRAVARIQQIQALANFLPLAPVYFDAAKKTVTNEEKDLSEFAKGLFHPFHHSEFMPELPAFLRQLADVLDKNS